MYLVKLDELYNISKNQPDWSSGSQSQKLKFAKNSDFWGHFAGHQVATGKNDYAGLVLQTRAYFLHQPAFQFEGNTKETSLVSVNIKAPCGTFL